MAYSLSQADELSIRTHEMREALLARISEVKLQLGESIQHDALRLFDETKQHLETSKGILSLVNGDDFNNCWIASILYCASRLRLDSDHAHAEGFSLSNLLCALKSQPIDFFRVLSFFVEKSGSILSSIYGEAFDKFQKTRRQLQSNFFDLFALYNHYVKSFNAFFVPYDKSQDPASSISAWRLSSYLRFGWMIFLCLRIHYLGQFEGLKPCSNGLIAVLVIMIIHAPGHLKKASMEDISTFAVRSSEGVNITSSLCHQFKTPKDDVTPMEDKVNSMIQLVFDINETLSFLDASGTLAGIDTDGITYFKGLMEESSLHHYIDILEDKYMEMYCKQGGIDERCFLPDRKAFNDSATNISAPEWVFYAIGPLPAKPSPSLVSLSRSSGTDKVLCRAHVLLDPVFSIDKIRIACIEASKKDGLSRGPVQDNAWIFQRKSEALKLYYKVLGKLCETEAQGLNHHNLISLLSNERFHQSMLVCSAEVILATYLMISVAFPDTLDQMGITAYDLCMLIESFVQLEEILPWELRSHLNLVEEELLSESAWTKGSSLYNYLSIAKPHLKSEICKLSLLDPKASLDYLNSQFECSVGILQLKIALGSLDGLHGLQLPSIPFFSNREDVNSFVCPGGPLSLSSIGGNVPAMPDSSKALAQPSLHSSLCQGPTLVGEEACVEIGVKIFFQKV